MPIVVTHTEFAAWESCSTCGLISRTVCMCNSPRPIKFGRVGSPDLISGVRIGPWVVFRDQEGMRHAVKQGAILSISECEGDVTSIVMTGSRTALIRQTFDRVLAWFR